MDGHNDYFGRALRLMQVGFWIGDLFMGPPLMRSVEWLVKR